MPIGDYCQRSPVTVKAKLSIREAAQLMKRENTGSLVVVEGKHAIGLLTDRDVALGTIAARRDPDEVTVEELMSRPAVTISEQASIRQAAGMMRRNALRRLVVVDARGQLVGIVSSDDVLRLVSGELAQLGEAVARQIPGQTSAPAVAG